MAADDAVVEVVRGWMAKGEADLEAARLLLTSGPQGPMDAVAFHAQQCAEKHLKALLCLRGADVPRTHDVEALLTRTGLWEGTEVSVEESRLLTDYGTVTRYPGDYEPVSPDEAAEAIELAKRIRRAVREAMVEGE